MDGILRDTYILHAEEVHAAFQHTAAESDLAWVLLGLCHKRLVPAYLDRDDASYSPPPQLKALWVHLIWCAVFDSCFCTGKQFAQLGLQCAAINQPPALQA